MSNWYIFPPFGLIGPVLKFLLPFRIPYTIVVPEFIPPPYWWPELMSRSIHTHCLGKRGDKHVLLSPLKFGYMPVVCPGILLRRFFSVIDSTSSSQVIYSCSSMPKLQLSK